MLETEVLNRKEKLKEKIFKASVPEEKASSDGPLPGSDVSLPPPALSPAASQNGPGFSVACLGVTFRSHRTEPSKPD